MKIYILNGPNLNMLGIREPEIYGGQTYSDLVAMLREYCAQRGIESVIYQSNHEGDLVDKIQEAYFEGADGIVIVGKNESLAMQGVVRASSGAAYELPIALCTDGLSFINELKQVGFKIYAANAGGKSTKEFEFGPKTALIMGSEGEGIPNKVLQKCDESLGINMRKDWDSLNVSVAFGILFDRIING